MLHIALLAEVVNDGVLYIDEVDQAGKRIAEQLSEVKLIEPNLSGSQLKWVPTDAGRTEAAMMLAQLRCYARDRGR